MTLIAAWIVALVGLGIPILCCWAFTYEMVTGRPFSEPGDLRESVRDVHPVHQALVFGLVASTLALALLGAAVLVGAMKVQ